MTVKRNVIICDIDGCCLDDSERIHHYLAGDLHAYHTNWHLDKSITPVVRIYRKFVEDPEYRVLFITARGDVGREYTLRQLQEHVHNSVTDDMLLMRPHGDLRCDTELKPWLLTKAGVLLSEVLMAFDDRSRVANTWRALGIMCIQPQINDY